MISGSGTNLQSIIDNIESGFIGAEIVAVVSNKPDAYGLERAKNHNIEAVTVEAVEGQQREEFDARLVEAIKPFNPDLIVLAGFMRILTPEFIAHFETKMLNIHPSLLPKYRGLNTHQRALDAGDDEHGCSIHFVTPELDGGPVILQSKVPIFDDDSVEELEQRVRTQELQAYPLVVKWFCQGRLKMSENKAFLDEIELPSNGYAA
jgi:phosphoribosylglycinamide formyltransferase-1